MTGEPTKGRFGTRSRCRSLSPGQPRPARPASGSEPGASRGNRRFWSIPGAWEGPGECGGCGAAPGPLPPLRCRCENYALGADMRQRFAIARIFFLEHLFLLVAGFILARVGFGLCFLRCACARSAAMAEPPPPALGPRRCCPPWRLRGGTAAALRERQRARPKTPSVVVVVVADSLVSVSFGLIFLLLLFHPHPRRKMPFFIPTGLITDLGNTVI